MTTEWLLSIRNLRRGFRRNFATGVTIACGYIGVVLLGGYILRMDKYLEVSSVYLNHSGHVAIYKKGGLDRFLSDPRKYGISGAEQAQVRALLSGDSRVEFVGGFLRGVGLISNGCRNTPFLATGIDPEVENRIRHHPEVASRVPELAPFRKGRGFWEFPANLGALSITRSMASLLGKTKTQDEMPAPAPLAPGQSAPMLAPLECSSSWIDDVIRSDASVQLVANTYTGDFSAVDGVIASQHPVALSLIEDTDLVAPLGLLQKLYNSDAVTYLAVFLKDPAQIAEYRRALQSELDHHGLDLEVFSFNDQRISLFYVGAMNFLWVMAGFFLILVCGVVILSIANSLGMTVLERMTELGTFRALGFSSRWIAGVFFREALILSVISLGLALFGAMLIAGFVNRSGIRFTVPGLAGDLQFMLLPSWGLGFSLIFILTVVSSLTAYLTSYLLLRKKVVQLLYGVSA